ncbi:MAG: ferrochelatase [Chitinophagales bacterium]
MQQTTGILLVNLGTPDSPAVPDVRKYLKEFLLDERVIDIPPFQRNLLVRGIIAPFRAPKSAKLYEKIWRPEGSPLLIYSRLLKNKLQLKLGDNYAVELAMRYQHPSINAGIQKLMERSCREIIVVPLFPQYASASNGSVIQKVMSIIKNHQAIPAIHFTGPFFDNPLFIKAFAEHGKKYNPENYDHILFSFHGVPERQILKTCPENNCLTEFCCDTLHEKNYLCYRSQCFATARSIAHELNIPQEKYTVAFQSRLGKTPWIKPYSDVEIENLANKGIKKILAFSPSFVADCLETIYEIGEEYNIAFRKMGGEKIQLVESLNDSDLFVECLKDIITNKPGCS